MTQHLDRRHLLAGMAAAAGAAALPAQAFQAVAEDVLPLWPDSPPGAPATLPTPKFDQRSKDPAFNDRWLTGIGRPSLTVRRPPQPNGTAVMLIPGGGYGFLAIDNEGEEQARWLNAIGVTAFILHYRLPTEGWSNRSIVPLADAQRALRLIRASATRYGVDAKRVLTLGFSAGGHLAGSLATRHAERVYAPVDAADQQSARPDLAGLIYPVVSLSASFTHGGSRDNLFGTAADPKALSQASVENRVTGDTPPLFLAHASDDGLVPIANSLALYQAALATQCPSELHAFDQGGHGFGVRLQKTVPAAAWPTLFAAYARRSGVLAA
ncbi:alpha/beta hydrolase [Sphingomonas sp. HT-1]|uniref:alpha/beta hydrolase n=1 Tax=unclassified Sphingomonas TaxID=196159 RepID=UPI0002E980F7|nr:MULTISPECIES: alpha/beta hydrolase [unclassified Sphingomonas]KTF68499.1 esterase [Sphingomonas sp. WG]